LAQARPAPAARPAAGAERGVASVWPLLAICLGAVLVRALTSALLPNEVWPDETFQSTEQALRLISGRGMTPWEFQIGARSWILPGLATPFVALGNALSSDPRVTLGLIRALMIGVSTMGVWAAYALGARRGRLHGLFAAGLAAGWCELVYYSPHLLSDTIGGVLLLAGLAVADDARTPRRLFWAGVLLGAALVVRVQLSPAIGLAGLLTCGPDIRKRLLPLATGFALPVAMLGVLDWLTWGAPFHSVIAYVRVNLAAAQQYGVDPPITYLRWEAVIWGPAEPLVLITAAFGARRAPSVAAVAAVVALTFTAVGHKEPRFIYPALLPLFVLCAIGTGDMAADVARRARTPSARRLIPLGFALLWAAASASAGFGAGMRPLWTRVASVQRALDIVNDRPDSCGLGLDYPYWDMAAVSRMRRDITLYAAAETPANAYNYLLMLPGPRKPLASYLAEGFTRERCYPDGICLYHRPGPCVAGPAPMRADTPPRVRAQLSRLGYSVY
jgi:hypothetical protein